MLALRPVQKLKQSPARTHPQKLQTPKVGCTCMHFRYLCQVATSHTWHKADRHNDCSIQPWPDTNNRHAGGNELMECACCRAVQQQCSFSKDKSDSDEAAATAAGAVCFTLCRQITESLMPATKSFQLCSQHFVEVAEIGQVTPAQVLQQLLDCQIH